MSRVLFRYEEMECYRGAKAVLMYSGGLDSMFAAHHLKRMGLEVHAIVGNVGQPLRPNLQRNAEKLGIHVTVVELRARVVDHFIAKGLLANALVDGHFPISSSYTRPVIATEACKRAQSIGSELIVHSATPFQNSGARFNLTIMAMAPELTIFSPAVGEFATRDEKIKLLRSLDLEFDEQRPIYSIDENVWSRVIENGTLEEPWLDIPNDGIFAWTTNPEKCELAPIEMSLRYEHGLPVEVDGERRPLLEIISELNRRLGPYGIGRFAGLEDGSFGVKNPEIREAPAAAILHESHRIMEEMILSSDELRVKRFLDREWTHHVVLGGWYSPLKKHLEAAIISFNRDLTGAVRWRVTRGQSLCIARESSHALYAARFPEFVSEFQPYTLNSLYAQMARRHRIDNHPTVSVG